eukprot:3025516-Pyramimonas_sp.AAC.1
MMLMGAVARPNECDALPLARTSSTRSQMTFAWNHSESRTKTRATAPCCCGARLECAWRSLCGGAFVLPNAALWPICARLVMTVVGSHEPSCH